MNLVDPSHPAFTTPAAPIADVRHFARLIEKMQEFIKSGGHVGVAAPQFGASVQLFVTRYDAFKVVMNPEWRAVGIERVSKPEASLSRPNWSTYVPRWERIHAEWYNADGQLCQADLRDMEARVFQYLAQFLSGRQFWEARQTLPEVFRVDVSNVRISA